MDLFTADRITDNYLTFMADADKITDNKKQNFMLFFNAQLSDRRDVRRRDMCVSFLHFMALHRSRNFLMFQLETLN